MVATRFVCEGYAKSKKDAAARKKNGATHMSFRNFC